MKATKIAARVRPLTSNEEVGGAVSCLSITNDTITIKSENTEGQCEPESFELDFVSGPQTGGDSSTGADPALMSSKLGSDLVSNTLSGFNSTLLVYGQPGSGKKFSFIGDDANRGLVFSIVEELFARVLDQANEKSYRIQLCMLLSHEDKVFDLYSPAANGGAGDLVAWWVSTVEHCAYSCVTNPKREVGPTVKLRPFKC